MDRPTMDDVAARAGVSRSLVSLVMRNSPRVAAASRDRVQAAANELGYRTNMLARSLASDRTMTIGVMLNDLHNPYFTEMVDGVARAADAQGYELLITSGWRRPDGEQGAVESLLTRRVDGVILGGARLSADDMAAFGAETPMVAVSGPSDPVGFDVLRNDEGVGAELIVEHLNELGHARIAHIDGGTGSGADERRAGFIESMLSHGLGPVVISGDFDEQAGYEGAQQLLGLHDPPTAIFAANDLSAMGVLSFLRERDISVPSDVSVVGYDDTLLAGLGAVSLTTVHQPRADLGRMATELLVERIGGRTESVVRLIEPRLVARSSTARAITAG